MIEPAFNEVTDAEQPAYLASVEASSHFGPFARFLKRPMDIAGALIAVVALSPLFLVVWASLRISLGRHVIFRQSRIGRGGKQFNVYKFRTMEHDRRGQSFDFVGSDRRTTHKTTEDPRHTQIGQLIRRFSLDELPQLFNILKGEMSLVGPRPEMTSQADEAFIAHSRHSVRPGMTGPYQVSDFRLDGDLAPGLPLDADYAANVSLRGDIRLLLQTIGVLARGTGS